eukprot:CAMPEP_0201595942 /NCGR_PEP_ID=MMETSP0190_2-20130828/192779_1 /ASSEMBLY_ACC=CAM_ASM_000263 /TAXON_ID=37353 /ORGANISM="Rosalina sp." /LENGTH=144 /DNA_ID=CAMNT_0048056101 /DNA_START=1082 /DNA_END=1513 /DNA_ORIENTATION=+
MTAAGLFALNGTFLFRTFMHPQDQSLKKVFGATRKVKADLVLGDWLLEDYDERLNQVSYFDELSDNINNNGPMLGVGDALTKIADGDGYESMRDNTRSARDQIGTFDEFMKNVRNLGSGTMLHQKVLPDLSIDDVSKSTNNGEW